MKKTILTLILLFSVLGYSQQKTVQSEHTMSVIDNAVNTIMQDYPTTASRITSLEGQLAQLQADFDTLVAYVQALVISTPPILTPLPPTFIATGSSISAGAITSITATSTTDSIQFEYRSYQGNPLLQTNYTTSVKVDSGVASTSITGLVEGITYEVRAFAIKWDSGIRRTSNYSAVDTFTTLVTPPAGGGGNTYLYVSASATNGTGTVGDPYSVSQANGVAVAGDTIIVLDGTYNFNSNYTFSRGGTVSQPVVWLAENEGQATFVANHSLTVDAFVLSANCQEFNGINWKGSTVSTRTVIQINGDYISLKNGRSDYRGNNNGSNGNDNIRGENCSNLLIQNWVVDSSAYNGINIQISGGIGRLHNLVFDNVTLQNLTQHNGFNVFPNTSTDNTSMIIDTVIIKNCKVYNTSSGSSSIFLRRVKGVDIYNNILEGDISFNVNYDIPNMQDTLPAEYFDRKSVIAHNTIIAHPSGSKVGLWNTYANGLLIKNNVWYGEFSGEDYFMFRVESTNTRYPIYRHDIDYNCYYQTATDNEEWYYGGTTYTTLAAFRSARGFDLNSINPTKGTVNDAIFEDVANEDYTPKTGSVLLNAGVRLDLVYPFLALDRNGVSRAVSNPTIGSIQ